MTHVTCRLTAKNRDQLRNPTLGNGVWATFLVPITRKHRRRSNLFAASWSDACASEWYRWNVDSSSKSRRSVCTPELFSSANDAIVDIRRSGAALWSVSFTIRRSIKSVLPLLSYVEYTPFSRRLFLTTVCKDSVIRKPEVRNVSLRHQRKVEQQPLGNVHEIV